MQDGFSDGQPAQHAGAESPSLLVLPVRQPNQFQRLLDSPVDHVAAHPVDPSEVSQRLVRVR